MASSLPGPHPLPPVDFANRSLPILDLEQRWLRIHVAGKSALYWGNNPPRFPPGRWDAPDGSYGVLYVGSDAFAAFIETFGHNTGIRAIQTADLVTRQLSRITTRRPVRLVGVTGPHLAKLGADARLFSADYGIAQQWSRAICQHPSAPDGILYPSRHDETRLCAAFFDHLQNDVSEQSVGTLAEPQNTALLASLLDTYGFGLV
ncbi:MAG TPA: RES family NAD+ phosphorylase [Chloroflexota bacterium]|nr:RES family NAD+ phosphorylase [Chloroflexota bacterium]